MSTIYLTPAMAHIVLQQRHEVSRQIYFHELPILKHRFGDTQVTAKIEADRPLVITTVEDERARLAKFYGTAGDPPAPVYTAAYQAADLRFEEVVKASHDAYTALQENQLSK